MPRKREREAAEEHAVEFIDRAKRLCDESETASVPSSMRDDERDPVEEHDVSLARLDQEQQGAFYSLPCPICKTYLGTSLQIDSFPQLQKFQLAYYSLRDVLEAGHFYKTLAGIYNNTLAEPGEKITDGQVRNHFESDHLQDFTNSLSQSIRRLATTERQLALCCFSKDTTGKVTPNADNINLMMKVAKEKTLLHQMKETKKVGM